MDHLTYLESYLSATNTALDEIALLHGKQDWTNATSAVTALRTQQDALWTEYVASAQQLVNP